MGRGGYEPKKKGNVVSGLTSKEGAGWVVIFKVATPPLLPHPEQGLCFYPQTFYKTLYYRDVL